jgi:two-component system, NarL family, response regulator NreC
MIKIFIADDHAVLRQALAEMLEKRGRYSIIGQASNGEELLNQLKNCKPDLIIMDVIMPRLSGIDVLERLANHNMKIPVLALSSDGGDKNIRSVLKAGAKGFMPKNAGIEELEFAIQAITKGNTYLSPSITEVLMNSNDTIMSNAKPLSVLTKREIEILKYLADGKANRAIGKMLHISTRTVDTHRSNILKKLNVKTNAELVKIAISNGLIDI